MILPTHERLAQAFETVTKGDADQRNDLGVLLMNDPKVRDLMGQLMEGSHRFIPGPDHYLEAILWSGLITGFQLASACRPEDTLFTREEYQTITFALAYVAHRVNQWDWKYRQYAEKMETLELYNRVRDNYHRAEDRP